MPPVIGPVIGLAAAASAAAGTAGVGVFGATAFTIGVAKITVGTVVSIGLTVAGSVLQVALTSQQSANQGSNLQQATLDGDVSPFFYYFGKVRRGGYLIFYETTAPNGAGALWRVILTDCGETNQVIERLLNNEVVTLTSGAVDAGRYSAGRVFIYSRDGTDSQTAISELTTDVPLWTADHRARGRSIVAIKQNQVGLAEAASVYPNGPNGVTYTETVESAKIYDPRTATTAYSDNGALCVRHLLTHPQFGALAQADFSDTSWQAAANTADQSILDSNGNIAKRYTLAGRFSAPLPGEQAGPVVAKVTSCLQGIDAILYEDPADDGKLAVQVGVSTTDPRPALTGDSILSLEITEGPGILAGYDAFRVRYTEPKMSYSEHVTPPYGADGFITGQVSNLNVLTVSLLEVNGWDQALRIAKKLYLRSVARVISVTTDLTGLKYRVGSPITINTAYRPAIFGRVIARDFEFGERGFGVVNLTVEEVSDEYMRWNVNTEGVPLDLPPLLNSQGVSVDPPQSLAAAATSGGKVRVRWATIDANVDARIEWAETGTGVYDEEEIESPHSSGAREIDTSGESTDIDIRIRFAIGTGSFTDYSAELTGVDRLTPVAAQSAPTLAGASAVEGGYAEFTVTPASATAIWRVELLVDGVVTKTALAVDASAKTLAVFLEDGNYAITAQVVNLSGNTSPESTAINLSVTSGAE